jgi:hypothetical protein
VVELDLRKSPPSDADLAAVIMGPTGNLRAPALKVGTSRPFSRRGNPHDDGSSDLRASGACGRPDFEVVRAHPRRGTFALSGRPRPGARGGEQDLDAAGGPWGIAARDVGHVGCRGCRGGPHLRDGSSSRNPRRPSSCSAPCPSLFGLHSRQPARRALGRLRLWCMSLRLPRRHVRTDSARARCETVPRTTCQKARPGIRSRRIPLRLGGSSR